MPATINLLSEDRQRSIDMFTDMAKQMGIPLAQFFQEIQDHLVGHPLTDLSKYLIELSTSLENMEVAEGERNIYFDTRIHAAAIMLNTLEGRALALAAENEALRSNDYMEVAQERGITIKKQEDVIHELENLVNSERLTIRNQQIALDAKDQRIIEMEEENNSFQDVQRDRARLQEENNEVKAYASRLADTITELRNTRVRPDAQLSHAPKTKKEAKRRIKRLLKAIKTEMKAIAKG